MSLMKHFVLVMMMMFVASSTASTTFEESSSAAPRIPLPVNDPHVIEAANVSSQEFYVAGFTS